jgi:hypothetical protein
MSESNPTLALKVANAAQATRLFIHELKSENQHGWVEHFERILVALESGEAQQAMQLYQSKKSHSGPGSLSDVYPENGRFEKRWGQCSSAIGNIRLYLEYGIDRPAVELGS